MNRVCFYLIGIASLLAPASCRGQTYTITTVAGGGDPSQLGDGGAASSAYVPNPAGLAVDSAGNLYIACANDGVTVVRKVSPAGIISTIAGDVNAIQGYAGDGGPATKALLSSPRGVAVDAAGNLYIADTGNNRVRKVDTKGTITTVAGGARTNPPNAGDGGPATSAELNFPSGVAVDAAGNLYIADTLNFRVRKVSPNGTITTVAGNGFSFSVTGSAGDGGPATSAILIAPTSVALDAAGNLYIAETGSNRVRRVSAAGIITTVAGGNSASYSGDGGPATNAGLNAPSGVTVDAAGDLYIADTGDQRIRKVTPGGAIATIAGNGSLGGSGDGGPANSATLNTPYGIALGSGGLIYVSDSALSDAGAGIAMGVRLLTPSAGSTPSIKPGGIVSAGAFGQFTSIAPGSWIEIYGSNLAADSRPWAGSDFNGLNAPTSLDGTSVTIGGQAAFIDYISPGQVNAQAPSNVGTGSQPVIVTTAAGSSAPSTVSVNSVQPGLLALSAGGRPYVVALLPDGTLVGAPSSPAQPGDAITLYGVGFGAVTPDIPAGQIVQQSNSLAAVFQLFFGPTQAAVSYAGLAPGAVGLYQFDAVVPNIPGSDAVPLSFTLSGVPGTQTLYSAVQSP